MNQIEYRIGKVSGEIVVQNDRVGGDTVNIAARLEQIAEAGGICISETVFEQAHRAVNATYTRLGATRLKNIRYPVAVYRVSLRNVVERQGPSISRAAAGQIESQDYRPSIAILPFENLSEEETYDYFSDGVVEDVVASLAGLREMRSHLTRINSRFPRREGRRPGGWRGFWRRLRAVRKHSAVLHQYQSIHRIKRRSIRKLACGPRLPSFRWRIYLKRRISSSGTLSAELHPIFGRRNCVAPCAEGPRV